MTALSDPQSPLTDVEGDRRPRRAGIIVALSTATGLATGGIIAVASQGAPAPAPAVPLASSTPTGSPTTTLTPATPTASVAPAIVTPTATPAATAPGTGTSTMSSAPAADNTTTTRATTTTTAPKTTTTTKAPTTKPTTATTTTKPTTTAPTSTSTATTKPPTTAPTTAPPKTLDACPNGDWSGDRYDGTCGTPPKPTIAVTGCKMATDAAGKSYAQVTAYVTDPGRLGYIATLTVSGQSRSFSRASLPGPFSLNNYAATSASGCAASIQLA